MKIKFRKEDGSGLILALMTLMVLSVLGLALAATTLGGYRSGSINRDMTSAYYVAEAGANQIYQQITPFINGAYESNATAGDFFNAIENSEFMKEKSIIHFDNQFGDIPKAEVQMTINGGEGNTKSYSLVSKGSVNDRVRLVEKHFDVSWIDKGEDSNVPDLPQDAAAIIRNRLELTGGGRISGNIYFDSLSQRSVIVNNGGSISKGTLFYNPNINFIPRNLFSDRQLSNQQSSYSIDWEGLVSLALAFPEAGKYEKHNPSSITVNNQNSKTLALRSNSSFDKIEVVSQSSLTIDIGNEDVEIVVNSFDFRTGTLNIVGTGTLTVHVINNLVIDNQSNINRNGEIESLNLLYEGRNKPVMANQAFFNASLFIKQADIDITGGSRIMGALLTGSSKVTYHNGSIVSNLLIAPLAELEVAANIEGTFIVNRAKVHNGGNITYKKYDWSNFPFGSTSSDGHTDERTEIIVPYPINEPR